MSRTFYARGQTGQQLLLGAYSALNKEIARGNIQMYARTEMLELVLVDGHAKGIVVRDLVTGKVSSHSADAVILATGGYGTAFYLSTNAMGCNVTANWRAHKKGAFFANPCYTQIHPTCIPVSGDYQSKLTLMSESLRNDGRVWVPKRKEDCGKPPHEIAEEDRDYYLERKYPSYGNLAPRDISSRSAKEACDEGRGVGPGGLGVYLDFADAILRYGHDKAGGKELPKEKLIEMGKAVVAEKYGNLFEMYEKITGENAYNQPMRIYPAVHYTMGGLWVDYNLMSTIPGLHVLGEANFSDHGANRLGASALMQGLADGYFVVPYTIANYLAAQKPGTVTTSHPAFKEAEEAVSVRTKKFLGSKGKRSVDSFHRELGLLLWSECGMARSHEGLQLAIDKIPQLREEFWSNVIVPGSGEQFNQELEKAGRVADFLEFGELMCRDAQHREESCGGHFRVEYQYTKEDEAAKRGQAGEALRNDDKFAYVAAWEYSGDVSKPVLHREPLNYEEVHLAVRSYV
nr:succinate dehydrogenase (quinone) flavoprotein subunit [Verrucomicrobium spinosum]